MALLLFEIFALGYLLFTVFVGLMFFVLAFAVSGYSPFLERNYGVVWRIFWWVYGLSIFCFIGAIVIDGLFL